MLISEYCHRHFVSDSDSYLVFIAVLLAYSGTFWKNPMSHDPRYKRGPGELVDFQRSPPPSSKVAHPDEQEIKQR